MKIIGKIIIKLILQLNYQLNIKVYNEDNKKIINFEKKMANMDLIYDFYIHKFDKDYIYYQIIFNSTPNNFLKTMRIIIIILIHKKIYGF